MRLKKLLRENPIIAILRGIKLAEVNAVGDILYRSGIRVIEVPLNRPEAVDCIVSLLKHLPIDCLVGAGTVVNQSQLLILHNRGVKLVVTPNMSVPFINSAIENSMTIIPGIATSSEAYDAYHAGAKWLKLFPASTYGTKHLKALTAVLPNDINMIAIGGINSTNTNRWLDAGAIGVGVGSGLFEAGDSLLQVEKKVSQFVCEL